MRLDRWKRRWAERANDLGRAGSSGGGTWVRLGLHAVAGAFQDDGVGMVEEAVEHCGGDGVSLLKMAGHCLKGLLVLSTMEPHSNAG